jgi:hypothetical protein
MKGPASHGNGRRRRGAASLGALAALLVGLASTALVARHSVGDRSNTLNLSGGVTTVSVGDAASGSAPTAQQAVAQTLGALKVLNEHDKVVPLITKGEPAIIMISSTGCSWCKRALKDLGELSAGRPLPRLKLFTLEGAVGGAPMLAKEKIGGAQLITLAERSGAADAAFRGRPPSWRWTATGAWWLPCQATRCASMKTWYAVMVGDQDVP